MKKKVLIVLNALHNGGAEKSLVNLLNELPDNRYDIDLILFKKHGMFLEQVPEWVNILDTPEDLKRLFPLKKTWNFQLLYRAIATGISKIMTKTSFDMRGFRWKHFYSKRLSKLNKHYDLAIAYISGEILYYVNDFVDADRKISWVHNDYKSAKHSAKYERKCFENMDAVVTISTACLKALQDVFPEMKDKFIEIPNLTSSKVIRERAKEYEPSEFSKDKTNILSVGRYHNQKGFDMAIDAAQIMKSRGLEFCWYIIGGGELEESLKQQIEKKDVADCFILLGLRSNPYPYILKCDILAQPSRYEGKSVVIDEAKILGKPIFATNYPTVNDQLTDGFDAVIGELSAEGIADGLEKMIVNPDLREVLHTRLLEHEYGNSDQVAKYMELFG